MFFKNKRKKEEYEYIKKEIIKYYAKDENGEESSNYNHYCDLCYFEYDDNGNPFKINLAQPTEQPIRQNENNSSGYYSSLSYYDDDDYDDDLYKDPRHSCFKYPFEHPFEDPFGYPFSDTNY